MKKSMICFDDDFQAFTSSSVEPRAAVSCVPGAMSHSSWLLIAVPAEVTAWLVADNQPPEKMYIPFGASFIVVAWADAAIRQSRRINFGSVFIGCPRRLVPQVWQ